MRAIIFKTSLVASLLFAIALVGAWPTRSDNSSLKTRIGSEERPGKRGGKKRMTPYSYRSPGAKHKLVIPAEDRELRQALHSSRERKYGAYSIIEVSDETLDALDRKTLERAELRDDLNIVMLRRGQIDTAGPEPRVGEDLRQQSSSPRALHLVQLFGPPTTEAMNALKATGVQVVLYVPNNAYVVWASQSQLSRVRALRNRADVVQWDGPFHPAYKLDSRIKLDSIEQIPTSIEIIDTPAAAQTIEYIKSVSQKVLMTEFKVAGTFHIKVLAESLRLKELARMPDVLAIGPASEMKLMDERASQITAGHLTFDNAQASHPTSPGYLSFLNSVGFNSDFDFAIDVGDTGFDIGSGDAAKMHSDFTNASGQSRVAYLNDFTNDSNSVLHRNDPTVLPAHDPNGHGTLNISIAAGFNQGTGSAFTDSLGFNYGLGIAPFARVGASKIFSDPDANGNVSFSDAPFADFIAAAYRGGARISSHSWGTPCDSGCNFYDGSTLVFDYLVRDADIDTPGNESMVIVFAAGNDGDTNLPSVTIPGTAKNVITVGASENVRGSASEGCAGVTLANNAQDVVLFSGFGPTDDGRAKPDIVAPGTNIQGAATQDRFYLANPDIGVCARFFPLGQTRYTWSVGTSHATPAVSGGAALSYQWLRTRLGADPSAALVKAFLLNSTSYLNGTFASGNLPSAHQGWGLLDLGRAFETTDRIIYDQAESRTFTESGGAPFEVTGMITDSSKEFRVMLAYTDAPGSSITNAPYVNQLNLEVVVGGVVYQGNVFNGQYSTTGGQQDFLNNTQGVRLPAGTEGPFVIRVRPTIIAGDGVPNSGGNLDQDFALVVTNGKEAAVPVLTVENTNDLAAGVTVLHSNGTSDASVLPGEGAKITVTVTNKSQTAQAIISGASLSVPQGGSDGNSSFHTIQPGQTGSNDTPFQLIIPASLRCGQTLVLQLELSTFSGIFKLPVRVQVGRPILPIVVNTILSDDVDGGRVKWKKKKGFDAAENVGRSGVRSYHAVDPGRDDNDNDQLSKLTMKKAVTIPANAGHVRLWFFHIFNFEPGFDGGVLEISADGGDWEDLGSRIISGGYDGQVTETTNNPLENRFAWTSRGKAGVFSQVVINLDDFAGKKIKLRFQAGFDAATGILDGYTGWFIDDIQITANSFACGSSQTSSEPEVVNSLSAPVRKPVKGRLNQRVE
ncbi:MAG TPA: S8 family serine peptidase [Blastocatellia bacterium]|nr:S8 family serine peptidase [Blastocatellia bacterium]